MNEHGITYNCHALTIRCLALIRCCYLPACFLSVYFTGYNRTVHMKYKSCDAHSNRWIKLSETWKRLCRIVNWMEKGNFRTSHNHLEHFWRAPTLSIFEFGLIFISLSIFYFIWGFSLDFTFYLSWILRIVKLENTKIVELFYCTFYVHLLNSHTAINQNAQDIDQEITCSISRRKCRNFAR